MPDALPDPLLQLTVLLIEDEEDVARTTQMFLERSGMQVVIARRGADAVQIKPEVKPDVVLVDMGLPDTNGVSLIPWLVREGDCGIIVVSGANEEYERVVGMELGADDYVVKPAPMRELVARIRAVHRRVAGRRAAAPAQAPEPERSSTLTLGEVTIDLKRRVAQGRSGDAVSFTTAEFRALEVLAEGLGAPVSREQICQAALNRPLGFEDRAVDQLIVNIRRKIGEEEGRTAIRSVRGAGYALHV